MHGQNRISDCRGLRNPGDIFQDLVSDKPYIPGRPHTIGADPGLWLYNAETSMSQVCNEPLTNQSNAPTYEELVWK